MLLSIIYFFFYFKFSENSIFSFIRKEKVTILKSVLKKGHYKNRMQIAENLMLLCDDYQKELIEILLDEPIEIIFNKMLLVTNHLNLSESLQTRIQLRKEYWYSRMITENNQKEVTQEKLKGTENFKRKFGNGESLNMVKEMLKKPMNTGKWF